MFPAVVEVLAKNLLFDYIGPFLYGFTSLACAAHPIRNICVCHYVQIVRRALHNDQRPNARVSDADSMVIFPYAHVNRGLLLNIVYDTGLNVKCLVPFRSRLPPLWGADECRGHSHMSRAERIAQRRPSPFMSSPSSPISLWGSATSGRSPSVSAE